MKIAIMILTALMGMSAAHADELVADKASPNLFTCQLKGDIRGQSVAIIIGGQYISGPGTLKCVNNQSGRKYRYPVTLQLTGMGFGFDFTVINRIHVVTAGIGVNDPNLFAQHFAIGVTAGASLIRAGLEFNAALLMHGQNGMAFELGMQGRDVYGLGAHVYAMTFTVSGRR